MPTNTFGPNDNYDKLNSHFIPALIRKIHEIKNNKKKQLILWGNGLAKREILYVDDLAEACVYFMNKKVKETLINIGSGKDYSIKEYALLILYILIPKNKVKIVFDLFNLILSCVGTFKNKLPKEFIHKFTYDLLDALTNPDDTRLFLVSFSSSMACIFVRLDLDFRSKQLQLRRADPLRHLETYVLGFYSFFTLTLSQSCPYYSNIKDFKGNPVVIFAHK